MRDKKLDVLKGIGIILMLFCHLVKIKAIRIFVYSFHMPLFFIIAGICFKKKGLLRQTKTTIISLGIPYVVTSVIRVLLTGVYSYQTWEFSFVKDSLIAHVLGIGWSRNYPEYSTGPIWFLLCMIIARIIFECILQIKNMIIQFFTAIAVTCAGIYVGGNICLAYGIDIAAASILFLYYGYYSSVIKKKLRENKKLFLGCIMACSLITLGMYFYYYKNQIVFNMVGRVYPLYLLSFITAIFMYEVIAWMIGMGMKKVSFPVLEMCGRYSLILLCIHTVLMSILMIWKEFMASHVEYEVYGEQLLYLAAQIMVCFLIVFHISQKKVVSNREK